MGDPVSYVRLGGQEFWVFGEPGIEATGIFAMTDEELLAANFSGPCPVNVAADGENVRFSLLGDPLDFIVISRDQAAELAESLNEILRA